MDAESKKRTKVAVAKTGSKKQTNHPTAKKRAKVSLNIKIFPRLGRFVYIKICPKLTDSGLDHSAVEDNTYIRVGRGWNIIIR